MQEMNILIVSNQPIEEYQYLCIDVMKKYCIVHNIDFIILDEYEYNTIYDYIFYVDNSVLIINPDIDIRNYVTEGYDLIYIDNLFRTNNFFIIKNNELYSDFINDLDKLKHIIDKDNTFFMSKIININNNNSYRNNDNLENEAFLNNLKTEGIFFYNNNYHNNFPIELLNYTYQQIFDKFHNNHLSDINVDYGKYNYNGDFEVFNPNKKIAFVTMYTEHIKNVGKETEFSVKEYCMKNGYTFYIHRKSELKGKRHPCLEKPYILKKYIDKHDYLIWVDCDILILDQEFRIENIFNDKYDFIAYEDPDEYYLLNSGFLIFKNNKNSSDIIDKWIFGIEYKNVVVFKGATQGDQGILIDIINIDYLDNTLVYGNSEINTPIEKYNSKVKIMHFMGLYGFVRPLLMKYINNKIFNK